MPTLVQAYFVRSGTSGGNTNTLTTPSFSPAAGDVLVVKVGTWDISATMGTPTGGGQTYTQRVVVAPASFRSWCAIYTATVSGSPGAMTVSSTPSASCMHSMLVEWWTSAALAATPVTASAENSNGTPKGSIKGKHSPTLPPAGQGPTIAGPPDRRRDGPARGPSTS